MAPERIDPNRAFDRPVIILAAPRSGSTFLFETLAGCAEFWTIGDESHATIESIRSLVPGAQGVDSNRLDASHADPATVYQLRVNFIHQLRDRDVRRFVGSGLRQVRLLEKTPKNSLRVPFLEAVFPGARYIYMYRDPRENISSMIDAWRSGNWVTYRGLPGWGGDWSLLLPPGWQGLRGRSLAEVTAWQWRSANECILDDLSRIDEARWTTVSYRDLVDDVERQIHRLCRFADVTVDQRFAARLRGNLPLSKYTLTPPSANKWKRNEAEITPVIGPLVDVYERIRMIDAVTAGAGGTGAENARSERIGRNAPCHCGSGKKYKRCHGSAG
jgi:hypothetical protein